MLLTHLTLSSLNKFMTVLIMFILNINLIILKIGFNLYLSREKKKAFQFSLRGNPADPYTIAKYNGIISTFFSFLRK